MATLAPPPTVGTHVRRGQCHSGIMAVVPGDPSPEPTYHYCEKDARERDHPGGHGTHFCGCGYVWDDAGTARVMRTGELLP